MRKSMKRNKNDQADFPGDCGDILVFSVICSMTVMS